MEYLVTGSQAKAIDNYTISHTGVPSLVLMERASLIVAQEAMKEAGSLKGRKTKIGCVCGNGNNGGDGIAAGRILFLKGYDAQILIAGDVEKFSEDEKTQLSIAGNLGMTILKEADYASYDLLIDAVFGIGLSREVKGSFAEVIGRINDAGSRGSRIIAVDIPSGVSADNGQVLGCAVKADVTVTFGYRKLGMVLYPGADLCGRTVCGEIGFDPEGLAAAGAGCFTYNHEDLDKIPSRRNDSNKGTYGKVLVIAGSHNMSGAAYFSAAAAYKTGAGLVYLYTPECNRVILQQLIPEAVLKTYEENETEHAMLDELMGQMSCVVLGPGLGKSASSVKLVEKVMTGCSAPIVADADALNILAEHKALFKAAKAPVIITPHLMELSRLTGYNIQCLKENLKELCEAFIHENGVICISKDARTWVFDGSGRDYVNTSGNNGMSSGGSGDVLTGIIAGLLAQKTEVREAARLGVCLHGFAGDAAAAAKSCYSMTASDLISSLPDVFLSLK